MVRRLTEQTGQQRYESDADQRDTTASHQLLHTLGLGTGIVITVTFQQIDDAPNAQTGTQRNNEGLQNTNSRVKKCHKLNVAERKECRHECRTDHGIFVQLSFQKFLFD